jgi:nucleolar protein 56
MSPSETQRIVTTWFGAFLVEGERVVRSAPFPTSGAALAERADLRRDGRLAPEERSLILASSGVALVSRDRRLEPAGVQIDSGPEPSLDPIAYGFELRALRDLELARAEQDLAREWDPTVHVQEAVHALTEIEELENSVGERLSSWASRDRRTGEEGVAGHRALARELAERGGATEFGVPSADPALEEARSALARLYLSMEDTRLALDRSLSEAVPRRAPNLAHLLGPLLAARLIQQAGSLERLARLPASTIQVLGAERAFFEHLRGRAPPPKHGILFLHPRLHSAPRARRGRLARALAGKVAIAARLDRAGRPLDPQLAQVFTARADALDLRAAAANRAKKARPRPST